MFINKYVTINKHLIAHPCSCKITQKQRNMPKNKAGFVSLLTLTLAYMKGKMWLIYSELWWVPGPSTKKKIKNIKKESEIKKYEKSERDRQVSKKNLNEK